MKSIEQKKLDHVLDAQAHVRAGSCGIAAFVTALLERAVAHDASKFVEPELTGYAEGIPRVQAAAYGTPGYEEALDAMRPAVDHHTKETSENRHHPEMHARGVLDMTLVDVVEMLVDWMAAASRRLDHEQFVATLPGTFKRFGISEQLAAILMNTARMMGR